VQHARALRQRLARVDVAEEPGAAGEAFTQLLAGAVERRAREGERHAGPLGDLDGKIGSLPTDDRSQHQRPAVSRWPRGGEALEIDPGADDHRWHRQVMGDRLREHGRRVGAAHRQAHRPRDQRTGKQVVVLEDDARVRSCRHGRQCAAHAPSHDQLRSCAANVGAQLARGGRQPRRCEQAIAYARAQRERAGADRQVLVRPRVGERTRWAREQRRLGRCGGDVEQDPLGAPEQRGDAGEQRAQGRAHDATIDGVSDERLAFPRDQLRRRTVRGAVVNALFLGGAEALVVVQGLIVTILLGPQSVGLYGIVTTTAMTVVALRRIGIDEAFVQQSEEHQGEEFQRAFTLELIVGGAFSLVLLIAAPVVALAYNDSRLIALMAAVAYLPTAFALQAPTWIFFRRMDFVRVRALQAIIPVLTFCVTVPLAATTHSVWALVIGPFVGNSAAVLVGIRVSPYRLALRFDQAARSRYFRFSWPIFVSTGALLLVQQGQIFAFKLDGGLAAAGYITLAVTLTRYADRADQIIATTIYPAICVVADRLRTLEEIFVKSNRVALMWVLPFCAGFILFSPDLIRFVVGNAKWHPAVLLLQGLAGAAAIQQLGYNWFSFYRARGDSARQAVESAVMTVTFLGLAIPGLFIWGAGGFVAGRIASAAIVMLVRRHYVRRLLDIELLSVGVRGAAPVAGAVAAVLALRAAAWSGTRTLSEALIELALFLVLTAALTWMSERGLLRELVGQIRAGGGLRGAVASA